MASLEPFANGDIYLGRCWPLIIEEILRVHRKHLPVELRDGADPSALWQLARRAPDELNVLQAHVPRVMEHLAVLDHDEDRISITHSHLLAHRGVGLTRI